METLPFSSAMQSFGKQALDAHKQLTDWQLGQLDLAARQVSSAMELGRATFQANVVAAQTMGKTVVDAFAPKA